MRSLARLSMPVLAALGVLLGASATRGQGAFADALVFDASIKELHGTGGETNFVFTFAFTNTAVMEVVIDSVRTSCGCTVAQVPELPWSIPAGGRGEFAVVLDARGKRGTVSKSVFVNSSIGLKPLTVKAVIPVPPGGGTEGGGMLADDRVRNLQIAQADRFAVFKGECADCHATPAKGKMGPPLYLAACGVCHDSHNRASMVPDLKKLPHFTDREHWLRWISFGRHGSLMPAFAATEGGPLTEAQVDSVADYLTRTVSRRSSLATETSPPPPGPSREPAGPPEAGSNPGPTVR
jgi:mono/diheme cytochrome c family protein